MVTGIDSKDSPMFKNNSKKRTIIYDLSMINVRFVIHLNVDNIQMIVKKYIPVINS